MSPTPVPAPLIVFAVPEEARPFLRLAIRELKLSPTPQTKIRSKGSRENIWPELRVLTTGMGQGNARAAFTAALMETTPSMVLTCGFAGGLAPQLRLGDLASSVDEGFVGAAALRAAGAKPARFHCADRVAITPEEKTALRAASGADVVEMESSVIRSICRERRIPSATVRVISDTADESLPLDFNALMTADYQIHYGRLAWQLVRNPGKIPELMRFQKRVSFSAQRLAETLVKVLVIGR